MNKLLVLGLSFISLAAFSDANKIADAYSNSSSPSDLVSSGWTKNDGGKGFKILQIVVKDSGQVAELHIDNSGAVVKTQDSASDNLDFNYDYKLIATKADWDDMGTGKSGPMYHMTLGGLSFKGPMGEAMNNMGPFEAFLINIGKNI